MSIDEKDFTSFLTIKLGLAEYTIYQYVLRLKTLQKYLATNSLELSTQSLEKYLYELKNEGLKNSTLNTYLCVFKVLELYYRDRGQPNFDLTSSFNVLEIEHDPIDILTEEEVHKIIETPLEMDKHIGIVDNDEMQRLFFMFLAYTGARVGEALELKAKHVDSSMSRITFTNTKNKLIRRVYIIDPLLSKLTHVIKNKTENELVFTNKLGHIFHQGDLLVNLKKRAHVLGIKKRVHPHLFRHTYATNLYMALGDLGMVALTLGHKDLKSTQIYIHLADEHIKNSQMLHPFLRNNVDPKLLVAEVEKKIEAMKLYDNPKFDFLRVQEAVHKFTMEMYKAIKIPLQTQHI